MKRIKKTLSIVTALAVILAMCVSFSACGSKEASSDADISAFVDAVDYEIANEVSQTLAFDEKYFNEGDVTGFRTAGSDADHAAAEYLKKTFEEIGLETEILPVKVDKWSTGDKHLILSYTENGEEKSVELENADMISYMSNGTTTTTGNDRGAGKLTQDQWKNMDIVDVGCGYESDYYDENGKEIDVKGKIVLAGVNQNNDAWIDAPYEEAYDHGAAAVIVYQRTPGEDDEGVGDGLLGCQNGEEEWDTINVQDICAGDYIPCAGISPKSAYAIKQVIENENAEGISADFLLTSELIPDGGESWEVIGKIPGTGNSGQRIVYGGHYDKYFYGLNDDCTSVGLMAAIASGMVSSGYQPYNDIYFVATGAEEWGQSGAQCDWAKATWEMISDVHKDWQGSTLAFINFEMPAIASGQTKGYVQSTYEMSAFLKSFTEADLISGVDAYYEEGVDVEEHNNDQTYMSDCISYQSCGIPTIINKPDFDEPIDTYSGNWHMDRYHTQYDDSSTYSQELMDFNTAYYGAMGIYMDKQPVMEFDFTKRIADLNAAVEGLEDYVDADTLKAYSDSVAALEKATSALQTKAQEIKTAYAEASDDEKAAVREEGIALNTAVLETMKAVQAELIGFSGTVMPYSQTGSSNLLMLNDIVSMLENKDSLEDMDSLFGTMFGLWGGAEYYALSFGEKAYATVIDSANGIRHSIDPKVEGTSTDDWSTGETIKLINTYDATRSVSEQLIYNEMAPSDCNFDDAISIYKAAAEQLQKDVTKAIKDETKSMNKIAEKANSAL